jgi:catechol 2,3-dioxygenase
MMSLPKSTNIQSYELRVKNLDEMVDFYTGKLGMKKISSSGSEATLSANGAEPYMLKLTEDNKAKIGGRQYPGLYHIAIRYFDSEALAKTFLHLFDSGQKFQGFTDHIVSEAIYLADPEGNGIELYIDKPRIQWTWKLGEIQMSNLPLNLNVLTDSVKNRNEKFTGMDEKTVIGHIHLQVSDLKKAEKFYNEILGMDITSKSYNGALFFSAGGYHHHIGTNVWHSRNSAPAPDDMSGLVKFTIQIPGEKGIEEIMLRAEKENLIIDKEKKIIKDFDGNKIQLVK